MTRKRLGITTVVDQAGRLLGVITDGDLRRAHLRSEPIGDLTAGELATRSPKTVEAGELAVKALEIMETFAITSLIILDAERRPVGVIHLHDILRAKIDV
jgi:arabinose-5-phosphate isomerase